MQPYETNILFEKTYRSGQDLAPGTPIGVCVAREMTGFTMWDIVVTGVGHKLYKFRSFDRISQSEAIFKAVNEYEKCKKEWS